MAIPMINITPISFDRRNALLDVEPMTRAIDTYRKGADEANKQREIARAGSLGPEQGYQHLMSVGLPEQARQMGLYPLQRGALEAQTALTHARTTGAETDASLARSMAPWQRALIRAQAELARQQGLTQGVTRDSTQALSGVRRSILNRLIGGDGGPDVTTYTGMLNPLAWGQEP